jgi:hypothetical protein
MESFHRENFALAAYVTLASGMPTLGIYIDESDYDDVMKCLSFVSAAKILVVGNSGITDGENSQKLLTLLCTVLHPVLEDGTCLLYNGDPIGELSSSRLPDVFLDVWSVSDEGEGENVSSDGGNEDELSTALDSYNEIAMVDDTSQRDGSNSSQLSSKKTRFEAPIFVRLMLDDVPVSIYDLSRLRSSSILTVLMSVYKSDLPADASEFNGELPLSHQNVALQLSTLVNAYMAEQTLERLRHLGSTIDAEDFRIAKTCMQRARFVERMSIAITLYDPKMDSMVSASSPLANDALVREGIHFIGEDIEVNDVVPVRNLDKGRFVVLESPTDKDELEYWCFIRILVEQGLAIMEIYHPLGPAAALAVMTKIRDLITKACHRANQRLLLKRLHEARNTSALLVLPDDDTPISSSLHYDSEFPPGHFSCPVVFSTTFELFHRCATNPQQVARSLEVSVLHIFALSNRRHTFVYKDEDNSVFYLSLVTSGGGIEADGVIQMLVYGVDSPGPSVTMQLTRLLKRRLLMIAVEMLSSVLTKNPKYSWRPQDLSFVKAYQASWTELDGPSYSTVSESLVRYVVPAFVSTPGMLLLYFRQNLCGSTYFQPLMNQESASRVRDLPQSYESGLIEFEWADFVFYYNNAPSKLDPSFQAQCTLTEKGAEYARSAGTGIAILEVFVTDQNYAVMKELNVVGERIDPETIETANSLLFSRVDETDAAATSTQPSPPSLVLNVKISGTNLKSSVLHDWVLLSFNQALLSLTMEHGLMGWSQQSQTVNDIPSVPAKDSEGEAASILKEICPALPRFVRILDNYHDLPDPAIRIMKWTGALRASEVASFAYELLEKTIFECFKSEMKSRSVPHFMNDTVVIRRSRYDKPRRVILSWDTVKRRVSVFSYLGGGSRGYEIKDTPVDCPEYLCCHIRLGSVDFGNASRDSPPKLFEEVSVQDLIGDDARSMSQNFLVLKKDNKAEFQRSFAFVCSIQRSQRKLYTYNWSPHLYKTTTARLLEKNRWFLHATSQSNSALQYRSLHLLAPIGAQMGLQVKQPVTRKSIVSPNNRSTESMANINSSSEQAVANQPTQNLGQQTPSSRRVTRPVNIRRPKLVGKVSTVLTRPYILYLAYLTVLSLLRELLCTLLPLREQEQSRRSFGVALHPTHRTTRQPRIPLLGYLHNRRRRLQIPTCLLYLPLQERAHNVKVSFKILGLLLSLLQPDQGDDRQSLIMLISSL